MFEKTTSNTKRVRFKGTKEKDAFALELRKRINAYFKDNNITRYANGEMYFKTVFAGVAWLTVWSLIISGTFSSSLGLLFLGFTLLGYVNIFIAFNIAHDANHNAYSASERVNRIMSYSMDFIGGNSYLFRQMHNVHHAFVNIHGIDVTLETHGLFRFTPDEPYKPIHRFQHIYTPMLYMLAALQWVTIKDFKWMFLEDAIGNEKDIKHPKSEIVKLLLFKTLYWSLHLFIPMAVLNVPFWWVMVAHLGLHILPGLTFALIFQVTHVFDGTCYPQPDDRGDIENNYAVHVLETTADFSRRSKLGSWLMGGINIHVVHHILPGICHVHYPAITKILIEVAEEHGLEYKEYRGFGQALKGHMRMLHLLSKPESHVPRYREYNVGNKRVADMVPA